MYAQAKVVLLRNLHGNSAFGTSCPEHWEAESGWPLEEPGDSHLNMKYTQFLKNTRI